MFRRPNNAYPAGILCEAVAPFLLFLFPRSHIHAFPRDGAAAVAVVENKEGEEGKKQGIMFTIKVPSSSANIGPGFDVVRIFLVSGCCLGFDVNLWVGEECFSSDKNILKSNRLL